MSFIVVEDDCQASIVVSEAAWKASESAQMAAARELQTYLSKATGTKLPIIAEDASGGGSLIHVGLNTLVEQMDVSTQDLSPEGFRIKTVDDANLAILGADDAGLRYGTYAFLETFLGVRWFFPGELGEVVPMRRSVVLDHVDLAQEPDYKMRWLGAAPEYEPYPDVALWKLRNRLGRSLNLNRGHAYDAMLPPEKYFAAHPEYYSLVDGKRGGPYILKRKGVHYQLCTTNPDVVRLCVEYLREKFDADPSLECVSVSPNDGFGWCECETCRAFDTGEVVSRYGRQHYSVSERIHTFVNQLAKGLRKTHPDKYITVYVYTDHIVPPVGIEKMESNVIPMFATGSKDNWYPVTRKQNMEWLAGWSKLADKLAIYDYYMYQGMPTTPRPITALIGEWIPLCYRSGARFFFSQARDDFGTNGPNYYLAARLLWDTQREPARILDEYYQMLYGRSSGAIKAFYDILEHAWRELTTETEPGWAGGDLMPQLYTNAVLRRCKHSLQDARRLAEGQEEVVQKRVDLVCQGFHCLELHMEAMRLTLEVRDHVIPVMDSWLSSQPDQVAARLQVALEAWEARDSFLESLRDRHIVNTDHDLRSGCSGTKEKLMLQWLLDSMKRNPLPNSL